MTEYNPKISREDFVFLVKLRYSGKCNMLDR